MLFNMTEVNYLSFYCVLLIVDVLEAEDHCDFHFSTSSFITIFLASNVVIVTGLTDTSNKFFYKHKKLQICVNVTAENKKQLTRHMWRWKCLVFGIKVFICFASEPGDCGTCARKKERFWSLGLKLQTFGWKKSLFTKTSANHKHPITDNLLSLFYRSRFYTKSFYVAKYFIILVNTTSFLQKSLRVLSYWDSQLLTN